MKPGQRNTERGESTEVKSLLGRPTVHQLVDYAVGFAVASAAVRSMDQTVLAIAAVVVIASTALFEGPLSAFRVFPKTAHRIVDLVVSAVGIAVAVSADVSATTRLVLLAAAVVLTFMSVRFTHGIRETRS